MAERTKVTKGNVFKDLGFADPEARNLAMRADLMMAIADYVRRNALSQTKAAQVLGVTQPRMNLLVKGKIDKFSLDALVNMASRAWLRVMLTVKRAA